MRILLIAPLQEDAGVQNWGAPSLGIIRISDYIRVNLPEINIEVFDSQVDLYDPIDKWILSKFDIVGISLLHYTLKNTLEFINKWKKVHPESLIVVGGNEAAANYQDIFDKSPTDIAVLAEGEDTFLNIVRWKMGEKRIEDISGIIFRKYAEPITDDKLWDYWVEVDFSKHRYPEYWNQMASLYEKPDYEKIRYVRLLNSSHCQRKCTFCSLSSVRTIACGRVVRPASLRGWQIMELVHKVYKQMPDVRTLYFCTDDVFYPKKKDFLDFIDLYKKSGYDYRILIQTSTLSIEEEDFAKLKEINCQHITLGIENCSDKIRDSLGKHQDSKKIENIIKWGKKYGNQVYYLIILIPPESTMKDLWENYSTITRWIEQGVQISVEPFIYVYKGTPLYEDIRYNFMYEKQEIEGTKHFLKNPTLIIPNDPDVRSLSFEFLEKKDAFIEKKFNDKSHGHKFKGETGPILVELLGELLKQKDFCCERFLLMEGVSS